MAKFAHIKHGRIHWIAPADQGPERFEPGFLIPVPDTANEGDYWDGTNATPPPPAPEQEPTADELLPDLVDAITATGAGKTQAINRLKTIRAKIPARKRTPRA